MLDFNNDVLNINAVMFPNGVNDNLKKNPDFLMLSADSCLHKIKLNIVLNMLRMRCVTFSNGVN